MEMDYVGGIGFVLFTVVFAVAIVIWIGWLIAIGLLAIAILCLLKWLGLWLARCWRSQDARRSRGKERRRKLKAKPYRVYGA